MKDYMECIGIERGVIKQKDGRKYKVESLTQEKVTTRWIEAVNEYTNEYQGEPAVENKYEYTLEDEVYYFMFPDGRGMILGKVID